MAKRKATNNPSLTPPAEQKALPLTHKLPFKLNYDRERELWDLPNEHSQHLASLYGVTDYALALNLFQGTINAVPTFKPDQQSGLSPNGANAYMMEMQPTNAVESMLLTQMMTIHQHSVQAGKRLTHATSLPMIDSCSRQLNQLTRTFTSQIEALHKLRHGGKQTVQVIHQHVQAEAGSQVMVAQKA